MKKDAFYFPHDSNAKDDPKLTLVIDHLGLEGYGIYFVLIEVLRDQNEYKYPILLLPSLARKYATTHEKIKAVVYNYQLFEVDEIYFKSLSLIERMIPLEKNRQQRKDAIAARWNKQKSILPNYDRNTTVSQPNNETSTTVIQSRVEERREEENRKEKSKVENITPEKFILVSQVKIFDLVKSLNENKRIEFEALKMNKGYKDYDFNEFFSKTVGQSYTNYTHVLNAFLASKKPQSSYGKPEKPKTRAEIEYNELNNDDDFVIHRN
jgi:hypothetical protein